MQRIAYNDMKAIFAAILLQRGFDEIRADECATIFATNSLEGVYSHGVNRFGMFVDYIQNNYITPGAIPVLQHAAGNLEQWDGVLGPGPLNAVFATNRAVSLAKQNGIGCIGLANTNHWMRGGYYAWHAAKQDCILIAWTNTIANMPAWGATDARLGNNPLVIGLPFNDEAIVLDMAMSQYAYGKLLIYAGKDQALEVPGGYDNSGNMTTNASAILASNRMLPAGYWKGAGLSLLLDLVAMILSGGASVAQITDRKVEYAISQVFIAIDISQLKNYPAINSAIHAVIEDYTSSVPVTEGESILYPGQHVLHKKKENLQSGIPVDDKIWNEILALLKDSPSHK